VHLVKTYCFPQVAGNLLKILHREYGTNCKVVGISDGFGVAEDPNGLDWAEMLRLFKEGLPIVHYKGKLSGQGVLMTRDTEEGLQRANSMFLRVKADVFVPAGGRPNTMNGSNWEQFLDEKTKQPSSSLIVEGANIFNTPEARTNLFKAGVAIVKDSSANKCGVITSSCEVQASMVLSKDEFLSIKDELVGDVVVKLKHVAKQEAELMFRAYKNFPGDLPHFSERISDSINRCTDAIADSLANVNPGDPLFEELRPLIRGS
jgi:glutamate dehydrogenase